MKQKILVLCTGNSCRSQMAEGFLKMFDPDLEVYSAGTAPSSQVHPKAIKVMKEVGIDISLNQPKSVMKFIQEPFDFVITVCGGAKENCPTFLGKVKEVVHIGFEDPAEATGTQEEILDFFREIRNQIKDRFYRFYLEKVKV